MQPTCNPLFLHWNQYVSLSVAFLGVPFSGVLEDIPIHLSPTLVTVATLDPFALFIRRPLQLTYTHTPHTFCRHHMSSHWEAKAVQQEVMLQPPARANERAVQQQETTQHPAGASRGGGASRGRGATRGCATTNRGNHEASWRCNKRWQHINKTVRAKLALL